jgi:hypothetical protein
MQGSSVKSSSPSDLIQAQLEPGEVVRWEGYEPIRRYLLGRIARLAFYGGWSLIAGILALAWLRQNPDPLQSSFLEALPMLAFSVLYALGSLSLLRELVDPYRRCQCQYAVTNRRALVVAVGRKIQTWSYGAEAIRAARIIVRSDGSGDILFERRIRWSTDPEGRSTPVVTMIGFYGIVDVDKVIIWLKF